MDLTLDSHRADIAADGVLRSAARVRTLAAARGCESKPWKMWNASIVSAPRRMSVRRSTAGAQTLVQVAQEHGVAADICLRGTGLVTAALYSPQTEITVEQELQLIRNFVDKLGRVPGIGLTVGQRCHLSVAGIWGFLAASCESYRCIARFMGRFHELTTLHVNFRMKRRDQRYAIVMDDSEVPADLKPFLIERDLAAFMTMTGEVRPGGLPWRSVELRGAPPAHADRIRDICGAELRFGCAGNVLWLDPEALDIKMPHGNALLARMLEEQCARLLARRQVGGGVAGKVRRVLLQGPGEIPGVNDVAARLFMAPRSLRRHLEQEGTSFREIGAQVRQTVAEEMLIGGRIKLDEIASRLGYADPSSFIAAFKRWAGVSPDRFRRQYQDRSGR